MPKQSLTVAGARHKGHGHVIAQSDDHMGMLQRREEILAAHPEVKFARDLGPLMGEYEREYWQWCIASMERQITKLRGPHYTEIKREDG